MAALPTGTITLLFTDIEGSTRLLQHLGERYAAVLGEHHALLRAAFQAHGGYEVGTEGDAFFVVFPRAREAVEAVVAAQRALAAHSWPEGRAVRVRMGLHTGEPVVAGGSYVGLDVHRAARLCAAGHGGQVLLSEATRALVAHDLPAGVMLRDLGEHQLKDLPRAERICQLVIPDLPADFPALRSQDARPTNLPEQPTPLIGRERDSEVLRDLLGRADVRLVTLTGSGGTGKTRLGLQVATELLDRFADGAFVVALAPIRDPELVASTIAETLGVRETSARPLRESLAEFLRSRQMLLLLDNFEQVIAAAPLVAELLAACPQLRLLITSREPLHVRGEHEYPVAPLQLPAVRPLPPAEQLSQYAAVALFIARAQEVQPEFAVTSANAPAVAEICARLDGLPLAIELAAARIKLLTPEAMLGRLDRRLKVLMGGARDLPARQQTMRGTIAWSYELLDVDEQTLFRRLAVFAGGWTLDAAEAVTTAAGDLAGDVLEGTASLVDKSLVRRLAASGAEPRFGMLETIREYGLERLAASGESAVISRAHAAFFLSLAEEAEGQLTGPEEARWLARFEWEHDNLRTALTWAIQSGEAELALRMAGALANYWQIHGDWSEGRRWLADALAVAESLGRTSSRAKALLGTGLLARYQGDHVAARRGLEESAAIYRELGDARGIGRATMYIGLVALDQGDRAAARACCEEALPLAQAADDKLCLAVLYSIMALVAAAEEDYERAQALWEDIVRMFRWIGSTFGVAESVNSQGDERAARATTCERRRSTRRP